MAQARRVAFTLKNERADEMPVFVEPWPEHYRLRANETLRIVFQPRTDLDEVIEVVAHDEGLTIYPEFVDDAENHYRRQRCI